MGKRIAIHTAAPAAADPATLISSGVEVFDTRDLADAKSGALARLADAFNARIAQGRIVNVGGTAKIFQIDEASRTNVTAAGALALAALAGAAQWPDGFYWIAVDNSHQRMSAQDCLEFAQSVANYFTGLVYANRAKKDAIAVLETVAACDAFDVAAGWPSNPHI